MRALYEILVTHAQLFLRRSLLPFPQTPARGALDSLPITQGEMIEYDRHCSRDISRGLDHHY